MFSFINNFSGSKFEYVDRAHIVEFCFKCLFVYLAVLGLSFSMKLFFFFTVLQNNYTVLIIKYNKKHIGGLY